MSIRLVAKTHPFDSSSRIMEEREAGQSLRELYASLAVPLPISHARFMINDRITLDPNEIPADGDLVSINVVPGGANNEMQAGGKAMGWAGVGMFALGVLVTIGTLGGGAGLGIALMSGGIGMVAGGISLYGAGDALNVNPREQIESAPYLRGSRNKSNLGGPAPLILGRHRIAPHNGGSPYTSVSANAQYLHQLFVVGQKDLSIESGSWKIGDTDLDDYTDVTINVNNTGANPTLYPKVVKETGVGREVRKLDDQENPGDIVLSSPSNTDKLIVDLVFNGLVKFNDKNEKKSTSVTLAIEYKKKEDPDGSYKSFGTPGSTYTYTDSTTKTKRVVVSKTLDNASPAGADWSALKQYDVRIRRITADATKTDVIDKVYWGSLRAEQNIRPIAAAVQADLCIAALKIKASDQLSGVIDQLSCVANLVARDYNGSGSGAAAWGSRATSNPASCYLYVLTSTVANPRPTADASIDWAALESWHSFCASKGYQCNMVLDTEMDRDSLLALIAECGRATPMKHGGKFSIIIDRERPSPSQLITPRNSWDYSGTKSFPEIPHALKMNFVNAALDWQQDQRVVYNDGYNADGSGGKIRAAKFQEVDCRGVTSAEQAWKEGRYKLAASVLRCESHTVSMDLEYLTASIGDRVLLANDVILVGLGYARVSELVMSGQNVTGIRVDEELEIEAGKQYAVTIRSAVGMSTVAVTAPIGISQVLSFTVPIPGASGITVGDLVAFGEAGKVAIDALVMDIDPRDDLTAQLTLVDYAPGIFAIIDNPALVIPPHEPLISIPGSHRDQVPLSPVFDPAWYLEAALSAAAQSVAIIEDLQTAPAPVASISAKAYQNEIVLAVVLGNSPDTDNAPVGVIYQRSTANGAPGSWKDTNGDIDGMAVINGTTYAWPFNRASDGYPESADFGSYRFRAKAVNARGIASDSWLEIAIIDSSAYKSWMPEKPTVVGSAIKRTIRLDWADSPVYGLARYEAQVSKEIDTPVWYKPALGLDPLANEDNYRQDASVDGNRSISGSQIAFNVPLTGQNDIPPNPQNTPYLYRVRVVSYRPYTGSESPLYASSEGLTAGPWSDPIPVMARPDGAADLIHGGVLPDALASKNMAAMFAYVSKVSGGIDDPYNVDVFDHYEGRDLPIGYLRRGDDTVRFEFNPETKKFFFGLEDKYIEIDGELGQFIIRQLDIQLNESSLTTYELGVSDARSQTIEALGLVVRDKPSLGSGELARLQAEKRYGMTEWLWGGKKLGGEVEWAGVWVPGAFESMASLYSPSSFSVPLLFSTTVEDVTYLFMVVNGVLYARDFLQDGVAVTSAYACKNLPGVIKITAAPTSDGRIRFLYVDSVSAGNKLSIKQFYRRIDGSYTDTTTVWTSLTLVVNARASMSLRHLDDGSDLFAIEMPNQSAHYIHWVLLYDTLGWPPDESWPSNQRSSPMSDPVDRIFALKVEDTDYPTIPFRIVYTVPAAQAIRVIRLDTTLSVIADFNLFPSTQFTTLYNGLSLAQMNEGSIILHYVAVNNLMRFDAGKLLRNSMSAGFEQIAAFGSVPSTLMTTGLETGKILFGIALSDNPYYYALESSYYTSPSRKTLERCGGGIIKRELDALGPKYTLFDNEILRPFSSAQASADAVQGNLNSHADETAPHSATIAATANRMALRDPSADLFARLFRSNYANQTTISGAIAYRINTSDNYIRFCSDAAAIRTWLGIPTAIASEMNAAGSAPMYACRAWVNFNGQGTVAIRASGNVSSITDNGTGYYTVNFAISPGTNYAVHVTAASSGVSYHAIGSLISFASTSVTIEVGNLAKSGQWYPLPYDSLTIAVTVFR